MKRFWIMLLAVAVALGIALPAGAVKPPKPPKPTTSAPIAVYLDAGPIWVHEVGDVIWHTVTIQNKTTDGVTAHIAYPGGSKTNIEIGPSGVKTIENLFSYEVTDGDITMAEDIIAEVTVSYGDGDAFVVAATSTTVYPAELCGTVAEDGTTVWPATVTAGEVCIWKPPSSGKWTVWVTPDDPVSRPTRMMVSVRDGVPGNWCTNPDVVDSGVVFRRLMPGDSVFTLQVLLPGSEGQALAGLEDGQCFSGGAGGEYFAVGNPSSFYLYTSFDGTATATHNP